LKKREIEMDREAATELVNGKVQKQSAKILKEGETLKADLQQQNHFFGTGHITHDTFMHINSVFGTRPYNSKPTPLPNVFTRSCKTIV